ncbi:MAG: damage-control phosphatase ARMT1 family protein, partial [Marinilabiliaceae bacterium]
RFFEKFNVPENRRQYLYDRFNDFLQNEGVLYPSPYSAQYLNRLIKKETGVEDLFREEKKYYNRLLLDRYSELKKEVMNSPDPRQAALSYALAGNIIDFGPPQQFDLDKTFAEALDKKPAIDDSQMLFSEIDKADMVLYVGDNAGEIVTDKLFIETLGHSHVVFATRGGVVLNDVTKEDARDVGMDQVAYVVDNGFDAPSTMPEFCSSDFLEILEKADVIISKGQGNFEGLYDYHRRSNLFFLLMVKCSEIARVTGLSQGDSVIMNGQRIEENIMADG